MGYLRTFVLVFGFIPLCACSGKADSSRGLSADGEHIVKGGYTVRFEASPSDAMKEANFLKERLGTLCRHPGIESSTGLNKVWLYSFHGKVGAKGAGTGYAILERGGSLLVSSWSTAQSPLDKKGLWTVLRDVKRRFGCDLPIENPFPTPN